jgi:hypothetical protein
MVNLSYGAINRFPRFGYEEHVEDQNRDDGMNAPQGTTDVMEKSPWQKYVLWFAAGCCSVGLLSICAILTSQMFETSLPQDGLLGNIAITIHQPWFPSNRRRKLVRTPAL